MRRDLHKYFLAGIACTNLIALLVYLLIRNVEFTIGTSLLADGILISAFWLAYRRKKRWRELFRNEDSLRSREMRCQMARMIGRA